MSTGTSHEKEDDEHNEPDREETGKPDPEEVLRRAEQRSERETREHIREMRKLLMRGAAFGLGSQAVQEFIRMLTDN